MNKTTWFILFLFFLHGFSTTLQASAHWTILNYLQANNNITQHALFNIEAMKRVGSNDKVNILVQLDQPEQPKTWRYKITKGGICDDASTNQELGLNLRKELTDAAQWAYTCYPAERTMLVLWNHGNGIVDEGKTWADFPNRGILYNFATGNYLTNQGLKTALQDISSSMLKKKIDILGMDACSMALVEIAYQVKDYAHYLVASQNIEIAPGWDYSQFLNSLTHNSIPQEPLDLAKEIAASFIAFNKPRNAISTLSIIDLQRIEELKNSIDTVAQELLQLLQHSPEQLHAMLRLARRKTLVFYDPRYVDLVSFFVTMLKIIKTSDTQNCFEKLVTQIDTMITTLSKTVVLALSGPKYKMACGLSLYFPEKEISSTYHLTDFARNSSWLTLLQTFLTHPSF